MSLYAHLDEVIETVVGLLRPQLLSVGLKLTAVGPMDHFRYRAQHRSFNDTSVSFGSQHLL